MAKKKLPEHIEFDVNALREGIEKGKKNVEIFETAIKKEKQQIKSFRMIISELEKKHGK